MKALFQYIAARIAANVPAINTVEMFNNQMLHGNSKDTKTGSTTTHWGTRDNKAFRYPACFIEFIIESVNNLPSGARGIKDYIVTVRFRFARESYKFTRLETFDFVDTFDAAIQMMAPTTVSGITFTTFQEIMTEWDEDHDNVELPYRDYRTRYRYAKPSTEIQISGVTGVITASIIAPIPTIDNTRLTEDGNFRILETGEYRLLEA